GQAVLGVGEIRGPYVFNPSSSRLPHQREVIWHSTDEWRAVDADPLDTLIARVRDMRNHVEIERHLLEEPKAPQPIPPKSGPAPGRRQLGRLTGTPGLIQTVLERKGQVILYGPPGTGKTYWAIQAAQELAARRTYAQTYPDLDQAQRARIASGTGDEPPLVRMSSFHPEYGYEDFIEGYRPTTTKDGQLSFELRPGVFKRL